MKRAKLVGQFFHQLVDLFVEATNRRLDFRDVSGRKMPIVMQHVDDHVAGVQHVGKLVDDALLQRKVSLDLFGKKLFAGEGNLFNRFS